MATKLFQRQKAKEYSTRRPIIASASRINLRNRNELQELNLQASRAKWQEDAWAGYDAVGEIKFAYGLVAAVMSRIRLYPAVVVDPDAPPVALTDAVTIERPEEEVEQDGSAAFRKADNGISPRQAIEARDMFRKSLGPSDIPGMLRSFALNISVPGECLLAMIDGRWQLKSTSELKIDTSGVPKLYRVKGAQPRDLSEDTPVGRVWREHPEHSFEADSAMRALLSDIEELLLLSRVIRSNSRARLNAGILFVPDEITLAAKSVTDDPEVEEAEEDAFEKEVFEALTAPVGNEDSANTVMPLMLRGPGDLGEKIRHILLERKTDEFLVARADRTLDRIMQGLDVPKDIVTGLANVKYSNAIQIDESLYKAHVEPLALMACDAITDVIYRPMLRAAGWSREDADRVVVWYDPSEVTTRPDRAADAQALYDAKELSGAALRAAYGFSDTDKPSEDELAARVALANTPPPELLMMLFQQALPTVLGKLAAGQAADQALPESLQQTLAGTEMPNNDPGLEPTVPGE